MKNLSVDEIQDILWGDNNSYVTVKQKSIYGQGRWSTSFEQVVQFKDDCTYWRIRWQEGSTEMQDYDFNPEVTEVVPRQVTRTEYVAKK